MNEFGLVAYCIFDDHYEFISSPTAYGTQTVALINSQQNFYLGHKGISISAAISLWEKLNGHKLTDDELEYILELNNIGESNEEDR